MALIVVIPHIASATAISDEVVIDNNEVYASADVVVPDGSDTTFIGGSPIGGGDGWGALNVYVLDFYTGLVNAHLFSTLGGAEESCSDGSGDDCIFLNSDSLTDASIGAACPVASECITANGALQDVTGIVTLENGGLGIFGGTIGIIEDDVAPAPEPSSLILFATGIAGLAWFRSNRRRLQA